MHLTQFDRPASRLGGLDTSHCSIVPSANCHPAMPGLSQLHVKITAGAFKEQ